MDDTPAADQPISVSVVVPTRNRPESLSRLVGALARQSYRPSEVLIVDASDDPGPARRLAAEAGALAIVLIRSEPSLCAQRNEGIGRAKGSHVLLMDDDVEPGPEYLRRLVEVMEGDAGVGAVTGALREPEGSSDEPRAPSRRHALFAFLFQLDVFADTEAMPGGALLEPLRSWFRRRGNTWSLAGWPLITQLSGRRLHAAVYGLGAALVRRDWLLASPFDEGLPPSGIGDNYGVALGFPGGTPITVLLDVPVDHHRSAVNRPSPAHTFRARVRALARFVRTSSRFGRSTRLWLAWSLVGRAVAYAWRGPRGLALTALASVPVVLFGRT